MTLIFFILAYTVGAIGVGWCLCLATHKAPPLPPKCDDGAFEPKEAK